MARLAVADCLAVLEGRPPAAPRAHCRESSEKSTVEWESDSLPGAMNPTASSEGPMDQPDAQDPRSRPSRQRRRATGSPARTAAGSWPGSRAPRRCAASTATPSWTSPSGATSRRGTRPHGLPGAASPRRRATASRSRPSRASSAGPRSRRPPRTVGTSRVPSAPRPTWPRPRVPAENVIKPESLIPFKVDKKQSQSMFQRWLGTGWFRPNDLKNLGRLDRVAGLYLPFFTFDAHAESDVDRHGRILLLRHRAWGDGSNGQDALGAAPGPEGALGARLGEPRRRLRRRPRARRAARAPQPHPQGLPLRHGEPHALRPPCTSRASAS